MKAKVVAILLILVVFLSGCAIKTPTQKGDNISLKKFASLEDLRAFLKTQQSVSYGGRVFSESMLAKSSFDAVPASAGLAEGTIDFSPTNIQVQGVDEPDITKTDGNYIYTVSGNKIIIVKAIPAEEANITASIEIKGGVEEIFVNMDKLIVFGSLPFERIEENNNIPYLLRPFVDIRQPNTYTQKSFVKVYDISNKSNPILKRELSFNGDYFDARMIGNWVYFVVNNRISGDVILPFETVRPEIFYFDKPASSYMFTLVGSINTETGVESTKTFLLPYTRQMFVSAENIYITHEKYQTQEELYYDSMRNGLIPLLPEEIKSQLLEVLDNNKLPFFEKQIQSADILNGKYLKYMEKEKIALLASQLEEKLKQLEKNRLKTIVYKIAIQESQMEMKSTGEIPGRLLNQFSMDEFNGFFRVATTTGNTWDQSSGNHVYVLDSDMKIVGKAEDLAPGETIFSARFIGERVYLVTFRNTDPLFVVDIKDPTNPKILGKLKIPGFSDYLHPYGQNHIIGIGKETEETKEGTVNIQGVKLALFDVSDPENPKEISKYVIGDRGTDSFALKDHKAFLFNREKGLLVLPILLAEINKEKYPQGIDRFAYGDFTFQGAYVFNLNLEKGFELKGKITHVKDPDSFKKSGYYYFGSGDMVKRSLYIGQVLYTVSDSFVKANSLADLSEIKTVNLPIIPEPEKPIFRDDVFLID